jgi:hypothetical protein
MRRAVAGPDLKGHVTAYQLAACSTLVTVFARQQMVEGPAEKAAVLDKGAVSSKGLIHIIQTNPLLRPRLLSLAGKVFPPPLREFVWGLSLVHVETQQRCSGAVQASARYWNIPASELHVSPIHNLVDTIIGELHALTPITSGERTRLQHTMNHMYLASKRYGLTEAVLGLQLIRAFPQVTLIRLKPLIIPAS